MPTDHEGYMFKSVLFLLLPLVSSQVYPEHYTFLTGTSVNGSSPTGNCSNVSIDDTMITCLQPTSSVLFDGRVPTLTELDGDMWASQLLTINTTRSLTVVIFDFTDTPGYFGIRRVEVVMFNCPQWGITSTTITLTGATARSQLFNPFASTSVSSLTSCESLVRVCLSIHITRPLIGLQFTHYQDSDWLHLAEVTFYGGNPNCPPNVILNPPTTTPPTTTVIPLPDTTTTTAITITSNNSVPTTSSPLSEVCECSSTPAILSAVIAVIVTALLATVIFVVVQVVICKCHPKFRSGGTETGASAGGEGQEYEQVDVEDVAVRGGNDATYMEVGEQGGITIELKENEAYGTYT